jgi:drug/metabolite transporter (DMT)-like permease
VLQADSARNRLVGIGLVSVCYMLFSMLDGTAKWLVSGALPVVVVVWMRFLVHAVIATVVLLPVRGLAVFRTQHLRWHIARALMFVAMTAMNFWALQYLQLTVTASIFFATPLLIALASAAILGEKLDWGRLVAIIAGFAGVLVIVRPGSAQFHPAMLLSLINALMYAAFLMMTRRLAAYDSPETIQYLPAIGAAILLAPFGIAGWETPNGWLEWILVCLLGVFGGVGHYLLALAHRYAPSSVIAPFLYQQVIYMALFGFIVFGDVPSASIWIGAGIVVACGLYLFARERSRA